MQLRPGDRLRSAVCTTEVMVVRAPSTEVDLRCGGFPMLRPEEASAGATLNAAPCGGALLGKRYADDDVGLELLCTKAGEGSLALGDTDLSVKGAKPLPSSD